MAQPIPPPPAPSAPVGGEAAPIDRRLHRLRQSLGRGPHPAFLDALALDLVIDRVADVRRRFDRAVVLGDQGRRIADPLAERLSLPPRDVVALSETWPRGPARARGPLLLGDLETLPLAPGYDGLVVAPFGPAWINDLPGFLIQLRALLGPDGMMIAVIPGGDTGIELRQAFLHGEAAATGTVAPRVMPMLDQRDLAGLMQRAGFALPVVEREPITLTYAHLPALIAELRAGAATLALRPGLRRPLARSVLGAAAAAWPADSVEPDGRIAVTLELLVATAWGR